PISDLTVTSPLSLHDALPILSISSNSASKLSVSHSAFCSKGNSSRDFNNNRFNNGSVKNNTTTIKILNPLNIVSLTGIEPITSRSEEHTSELQSRFDIVCRLL